MDLAGRFEKLSAGEYAQMQNAIRHQQIKIVEILENGTGDGVYKCFTKRLDSDYWDNKEGGDKLADPDETDFNIDVLNLFESLPDSPEQHNLDESDRLLAWQWLDDGKKVRWVGIPLKGTGEGSVIHLAYCAQAATAGTTIQCYLDSDKVGVAWEDSPHEYAIGALVIGTGAGYTYSCTHAHTSAANFRPTTGPDWTGKWEACAKITVHCIIIAGTALNAADPELIKGQVIEVVKIGSDWYYVGHLQGEVLCTA
jgi:hypothetical protein